MDSRAEAEEGGQGRGIGGQGRAGADKGKSGVYNYFYDYS